MKKDFFLELKIKMQREIPADKNQEIKNAIWNEINKDIVSKESSLSWLLPSSFSAVFLILIALLNFYNLKEFEQGQNQTQMAMDADLLKDEFFNNNLEIMGELDFSELSEEDWKILLGQNVSDTNNQEVPSEKS